MSRLAVLASGSGSNLQAILDAFAGPEAPARVVVVVSDKPGCGALERAARAGVSTEVVTWAAHGGDRQAFTQAIVAVLRRHDVDLVALAGFMRILAPEAIRAYPNRILNTHPALLPTFRGAHAIEDALAAGAKVTGVTVHVVDAEVDHGPIVAQAAVDVLDDDDADSLRERIKAVEHRLFPEVLADWARGLYTVEANRVRRLQRSSHG